MKPKRMIRWHLIPVLKILRAFASGRGEGNDPITLRASIEDGLSGRADLNSFAMVNLDLAVWSNTVS